MQLCRNATLCIFINIFFRIVWYSVCKGITHSCIMVSRCRQDGVRVNSLLLSESIFGNMHELRKRMYSILFVVRFLLVTSNVYIIQYAHSLWGLPPTVFYSVLLRIVTGACSHVPVWVFLMVIGYWPLCVSFWTG